MRTLVVGPSCEGHGKCYRIAPDLLRPKDDHGHAEVIVKAIGPSDTDALKRAQTAIDRCPEQALSWAGG